MNFPYGSSVFDILLPKDGSSNEKYLEYIGNHFSVLHFMHNKKPKITTKIMGDEALYTISDLELFDKFEHFDVHYYITSGILEKIVSRRFPNASCNVKEIDIEKRLVKISLKLR
jgi:hypothetical protein